MLKRLFDNALLEWVEEGIERKIYNKYFSKTEASRCQQDFTPIGYDIVQSLFFIVVTGIVTSLVILMIEILIHWKSIFKKR